MRKSDRMNINEIETALAECEGDAARRHLATQMLDHLNADMRARKDYSEEVWLPVPVHSVR
jgi:hypothetical protein